VTTPGPVNFLCIAVYMAHDISPEHSPSTALVDDLLATVASFDHAVSRADLTRATVAELHQLIAAVDAADAALTPLVAAVAASTPQSWHGVDSTR